MKTLVRLSLWTLLAVLVGPGAASAQPAPPPAPPPPDPSSDQPPAPEPTEPAPPPPAQPAPADTTPPAQTIAPPTRIPPVTPPETTPAKPDPVAARGAEWTSLRLLRAKGIISEDEYSAALKDMSGVAGGADATTLVVSRLRLTLFGYVQADFKYDSTQSCLDFCATLPIAKAGSYRGDHGRVIFSPRDSRLGLRVGAPEAHGIRTSGLLEMDFFGPTTTTEQGTWTNPVLRIRQSWLKLETPIVDILVGQTGNLFGWASAYLVAGSQEPGLPGQMYQRTPQLKVSRAFKLGRFTADVAVALERPPQQDSARPELAFGARVAVDQWLGYHTFYLAGAVTQPASIAITGDLRRFAIAEFSPTPHKAHLLNGGGVAVDLFVPLVPASKTSHDNALSLGGELVVGSGISDMYTGLGSAGTVNASIPPATPGGMPGTYPANFDPGLAAYDVSGHLELIQWLSYIVGLEFYPGVFDGRLGLWANYGHMESSNSHKFGGPDAVVNDPVLGRTREKEDFVDAGVYYDPTRATRVGTGLAYFRDDYVDGTVAKSYSVMTSAFLFF